MAIDFQKHKNKNQPPPAPEDPFADLNQHEARIQDQAAKFRESSEAAKKQGQQEAKDILASNTEGLTQKQKDDFRNERRSQVQKDLMNYNRMLSGQHSTRGVKGGVANASTRNLQNAAQDTLNSYERELNDLDMAQRNKNLAAIFAGGEGAAAQEALVNQQAWDRIMGYLQNKEQSKLNKTAQQMFSKI